MKTIYTPTEEELIEMGFIHDGKWWILDVRNDYRIKYALGAWFSVSNMTSAGIITIYPSSKQALIDFISNFNPNE